MYNVRLNLRNVVKSGVASLAGFRSLRNVAAIAASLAVAVIFSSCGGDDKKDENPKLTLGVESLTFEATPNGTQTVKVTSNVAWSVSIPQTDNWLSVSKKSGNGNDDLVFTAQTNTGEARNSVVTVSGGNLDAKIISVTQKASSGGGNGGGNRFVITGFTGSIGNAVFVYTTNYSTGGAVASNVLNASGIGSIPNGQNYVAWGKVPPTGSAYYVYLEYEADKFKKAGPLTITSGVGTVAYSDFVTLP
jgi:hypothetical protein